MLMAISEAEIGNRGGSDEAVTPRGDFAVASRLPRM
jgi:hypothetical protein